MQSHIEKCVSLKTGLSSDCRCDEEGSRYLQLAKYSFWLFAFELFFGFLTNSMALISDALHVLVDGSESIVSYGATKIARQSQNEEGVRRIAGYISGGLLFIAAVSILNEGAHRLFTPEEVSAWMILFAGIGLGVNFRQMFIHQSAPDEHRNLTHWWQDKHILSDTLASAGVVIGGFIILATGWMIVDSILSIAIGIRILWMIGERFTQKDSGSSHHGHHH